MYASSRGKSYPWRKSGDPSRFSLSAVHLDCFLDDSLLLSSSNEQSFQLDCTNSSPRRIPEHVLYCSGILLFDLHSEWSVEHGTLNSACTV
jgi:hypothetical protein